MADHKILFDSDTVQPLEDWVVEITTPIVEAIGYVSEQLEALYQELR